MDDKELMAQMINRSINNALGNINPSLRMFSSSLTKYAMNFLDPYIDAFMNPNGEINKEAASAFTKQEINNKVDEFMKKFEAESNKNGKM